MPYGLFERLNIPAINTVRCARVLNNDQTRLPHDTHARVGQALKRDGALLRSSTLIVDVVQCPYNGGVIQSSGRQTHCLRCLMATRFQLLDFIVSLTVIHIPAINRRANHARTIPSTR